MLLDARSLPLGATLEADLCIVGAGPAGITIARELMGTSLRIVLMETGGTTSEPESQALRESLAMASHRPHDALVTGRTHQYGGTSNQWIYEAPPGESPPAARMLAPRAVDFEEREGVPFSGWPFRLADLVPFYRRAEEIFQIGPFDRSPQQSFEGPGGEPLAIRGDKLATVVCQYGNFSSRWGSQVAQSPNVNVVLHATAVELEADPDASHVTRVRAIDSARNHLVVEARYVVLAAGGIENARLLLLSDRQQSSGLGNHHDVVGRFLMEHPEFRLGVIEPNSPDYFDDAALYDLRRVNGVAVSGMIALSDEVLRQEHLLDLGTLLVPQPSGYCGEVAKSMKELLTLRRGSVVSTVLRHAPAVALHPIDAFKAARLSDLPLDQLYRESRGGWSRLDPKDRRFDVFEVIASTEQAPNPDNRILLGADCDVLGKRKALGQWRWGGAEGRSIRRSREIFADAINGTGRACFRPWVELEDARPLLFSHSAKAVNILGAFHHPMGTTRMHPDPREGVVDEHCRVHGVENLFLAGSSIFPTAGGFANPTLTIVALALRLSDRLRQVFDGTANVQMQLETTSAGGSVS